MQKLSPQRWLGRTVPPTHFFPNFPDFYQKTMCDHISLVAILVKISGRMLPVKRSSPAIGRRSHVHQTMIVWLIGVYLDTCRKRLLLLLLFGRWLVWVKIWVIGTLPSGRTTDHGRLWYSLHLWYLIASLLACSSLSRCHFTSYVFQMRLITTVPRSLSVDTQFVRQCVNILTKSRILPFLL